MFQNSQVIPIYSLKIGFFPSLNFFCEYTEYYYYKNKKETKPTMYDPKSQKYLETQYSSATPGQICSFCKPTACATF